jgi:hypothetical protein
VFCYGKLSYTAFITAGGTREPYTTRELKFNSPKRSAKSTNPDATRRSEQTLADASYMHMYDMNACIQFLNDATTLPDKEDLYIIDHETWHGTNEIARTTQTIS